MQTLINDLENEVVIKKLPDLENKSEKNKTFNNKKNEANLNKKNIIVETKNHESKNNNLKWLNGHPILVDMILFHYYIVL